MARATTATIREAETIQGEYQELHIVDIIVHLDRDVADVVAEEAGRQAVRSVRLPPGFEESHSWHIRPEGRSVICTPIPLAAGHTVR